MTAELHTDRLLLRRWLPADLDAFASLCADPQVMRWIGDGRVRGRDECVLAIERIEAAWEERGFGLFALQRMDDGRFIGFCGLGIPAFLPEVLPAVEIGWRLERGSWGVGLATEAARAVLAFGLGPCNLRRIISIHQVGNDVSANVMRKLGMRFERATTDPSCGRRVHVYETPPFTGSGAAMPPSG